MVMSNFALLASEMVLYVGLMLGLFHARRFIGIGGLFCALGTLHFLSIYLGATFFFQMPLGLGLSPGTVVLYAGFLSILLLTYIVEGSFAAWQPAYGVMLGSFLLLVVAGLLGFEHVRLPYSRPADISFLNQMAALMVWGTLLVFVECLFIYPLFDALMRRLGGRLWLSLWLTLALTCTFDQALFFPALHLGLDVPIAVGIGNWIGKIVATAAYALPIAVYIRRTNVAVLRERAPVAIGKRPPLRDAETGALHRARLEPLARDLLGVSALADRPLSLLLVELDLAPMRAAGGDAKAALRQVAQGLLENLRIGDFVVRFQGDAFVVLAPGLPRSETLQVTALLRRRLLQGAPDADGSLTVGIATTPTDGTTLPHLLSAARGRVYAARAEGDGGARAVTEG